MTLADKDGRDGGPLALDECYWAEKNPAGVWRRLQPRGVVTKVQWLLTRVGPNLKLLSMADVSRPQACLLRTNTKDSPMARFLSPLCHGLITMALPTVYAASEPGGSPVKLPESSPGEGERSTGDVGGKLFKSFDTVSPSTLSTQGGPLVYKPRPGETGWDRIKAMYSTDVYGNLGPEWRLILQGLWGGAAAGVMVGFFLGGRVAAVKFSERNEGTKFANEMAARRALQDKMTLSMGKYSLMWGWRTGVFTGAYLFLVTNMSVYRGHTSILDFVLAGGLVGGTWKFMLGPKAFLVAGITGSILGLIAGGLSLGLCKMTGISLDELRYWHYQASTSGKRGELWDDDATKTGSVKTKSDVLAQHHDLVVKAHKESAVEKPPPAAPQTSTQ